MKSKLFDKLKALKPQKLLEKVKSFQPKKAIEALKSFSALPIRAYLLYLLIASLVFTGVTFSSYVSTTSGSGGAQVALFANDVTLNLPITAECYPGCSFEVPVTVSNYDGSGIKKNICEVSQSYTLSATLLVGNLPLQVEWKDGNTGEFSANDGAKDYIHTVIVSWPSGIGNTSYEYSDELEVLRITAISEQIN